MIRMFTSPTQVLGKEGEQVAVKWLEKQGYRVVDRNVNNIFGEIDIIAQKGHTCYFFEVKTGRQGSWFNPAENLTQVKIRKFLISCEHYALVHTIKEYHAQGIVVLTSEGREPIVEIFDIA